MDNHRNSNNTFGHQTITSSTTATLSPHHTFTSTHDDMGTWEKQAIPPVPPAVPPKQTPLHQGHDAPQPLSAYYTPHEYVDVNGMRNKAIIPANGFEKFSQHGHGGQPPATAKSSGGQGIYGMRRSTFVLVVALVVVVAVAIGLGVGLGVGLKKTGGGGGRDGGFLRLSSPAIPNHYFRLPFLNNSRNISNSITTTNQRQRPRTYNRNHNHHSHPRPPKPPSFNHLPIQTHMPNLQLHAPHLALHFFQPSTKIPNPLRRKPLRLLLFPFLKTKSCGPFEGNTDTRTMLGRVRWDEFLFGEKRRGGCVELYRWAGEGGLLVYCWTADGGGTIEGGGE